jgi:hypothetical protein
MDETKDLRAVNPEQMVGAFRGVVLFGSGIAIGRGLITKDQATELMAHLDIVIPALTGLATLIWGWWARKDKNLIVSAANIPGTTVLVPAPVVAKSETLQENPSVEIKSHWLAAIFVGSLLFLGGCQTAQAPLPSPVVGAAVGLLPDQIRDKIEQGCGYVASGQTILELISAFGGPAVPSIVNQIVAEVCTAVTRRSSVRGSVATVRGVRLRGSFVR